MTDEERLDWLEQDVDRLEDLHGRVMNEETTVREAIDWFAQDTQARDVSET